MDYNPELNFINKVLQTTLRPRVEELIKKQKTIGPLIVEFDPTTNCFFECPDCISSGQLNKGQISTSKAIELITEFHNAGVKGLIFIGGGEPLAHPNISDLFTHAYNLGISLGLTTNGFLINRHILPISQLINWTRVSIDAGTQKTFEIFRPSKIKDSFVKIISNLEKLSKIKKGKLGYSYLLIERPTANGTLINNCQEIFIAAKLAKEVGCDYFEFKPMVNENHHLISFSQKAKIQIKEQLEQSIDLNDNQFRVIYPKSVEHILFSASLDQSKSYAFCPTLELRTVVTPNGIYPCPYKRGFKQNLLGLTDTKFDEFWQSESCQLSIKKVNPIKDCTHFCIRHELNVLLYS